jgi:hypothetical protein
VTEPNYLRTQSLHSANDDAMGCYERVILRGALKGNPAPRPNPGRMSDPLPSPESLPARTPRLLTIAEAASETGLSIKAIARRIERGTLRAVHDDQGRRVVPRAELDRTGLLDQQTEGNPGGEVVLWRDLYERERSEHQVVIARERELHAQLAAIANAGPIRAMRLRKHARQQMAENN